MRRARQSWDLDCLTGGALTSGAASGGYSDELFKYSTATMTWMQLDAAAGVRGTAPSARIRHSMTTVGEDLYVFGGYTSGEAGGVEGRMGHAWLPCCVRHQSAGGEGGCRAGSLPSWVALSVGCCACRDRQGGPVCTARRMRRARQSWDLDCLPGGRADLGCCFRRSFRRAVQVLDGHDDVDAAGRGGRRDGHVAECTRFTQHDDGGGGPLRLRRLLR